MEDGHKSQNNYCAKWRTAHNITLMPHPSTSPDMNPIEKVWRAMKQSLHRRKHQPQTEAEIEAAILEEWAAIDQEWINRLILQQEHWVNVLVERCGWSNRWFSNQPPRGGWRKPRKRSCAIPVDTANIHSVRVNHCNICSNAS